jgi:hypothetical protein
MLPPQRRAVRLLWRSGGVPGRLTVKALRCASAMPPLGAAVFADRLYRYHSLPRASLSGARTDVHRLAVRGCWHVQADDGGPWFSLTRDRDGNSRWKLYLSPTPAQLYECVRLTLPILAKCGAVSLKLGRDDSTRLRPDRFVAYFSDQSSLAAAAAELRRALKGFEGLGVPFTSPIGNGQLLSWGMDLPGGARSKAKSWRQWVTSVLGNALFDDATSQAPSDDPVEFALQHLANRGVEMSAFRVGPSLLRRWDARGGTAR